MRAEHFFRCWRAAVISTRTIWRGPRTMKARCRTRRKIKRSRSGAGQTSALSRDRFFWFTSAGLVGRRKDQKNGKRSRRRQARVAATLREMWQGPKIHPRHTWFCQGQKYSYVRMPVRQHHLDLAQGVRSPKSEKPSFVWAWRRLIRLARRRGAFVRCGRCDGNIATTGRARWARGLSRMAGMLATSQPVFFGRDEPHVLRCERPVDGLFGCDHCLRFDCRMALDHRARHRCGPFPDAALDALNDGVFNVPISHHEPRFCRKHLTRGLSSLGGSFKNVAGTTAKNPGY